MQIHKSKVISLENVADNTFLLTIEKPDGYEFEAGQFVKLLMPQVISESPLDNWRWFSICCAPDENHLTFCGRHGISEFKKVLKNLQPGDAVEISEAKGKFVLNKDSQDEIIFLVNGVGIAPVCGMVDDLKARRRRLATDKVYLFYSNKNQKSAAFYKKFEEMDEVTFIPTMTAPDSEWQGETGRINLEMIKRHVKNLDQAMFYIVGSKEFVNDSKNILIDGKISEDKIIIERF